MVFSKGKGNFLHIGSGDKILEGWVNVDRKKLPGVDVVADVTDGLNFTDVRAVYAEHFLEHLPIDAAKGQERPDRLADLQAVIQEQFLIHLE